MNLDRLDDVMKDIAFPGHLEHRMSLLKKLLGRNEPAARVRVCIECGMPVEKHADWCAILRTQQEMDQKRAAEAARQS